MNYYKHHIGDYMKKTQHLSLAEHGAYLLMLQAYYASEKPLPAGEPLYRVARAGNKSERAAVDSIARQFWVETETGLVNGRATEEIETMAQQVSVARENGTKGGRPKKPTGFPKNNPDGFETEPNTKAIHNSITPEEEPPLPPCGGNAEGLDPEAWGMWVEYRKKIKKPIKAASVAFAQKRMAKLGNQQLEAVENSIASGYIGCYPPKNPGRINGNSPRTSEWE